MAKRANGFGSVVKLRYKKNGEVVKSKYFYILYRAQGRQVRESSESESKMVAEALLQRRLAEAGLGLKPAQDTKKLTYTNIRDAYIAEARNKGLRFDVKKDGSEYLMGVPRLDAFFKGMRVTDITTDRIRDYIEAGKKAGVTGSTIRRSLAVLRTMFNQARKEGKLRLGDVPYFPMPKEGKPRQGFVEPGVFESVRTALPENLRPLITFIYFTGCRKGAAKRITWPMIAKDCSEIILPGEITKTGEPLLLPLTGPLEQVASVLRKMFRTDGPVFDSTNLRKEWNTACDSLGLGKYENELYSGLTLHDLRRSAVRNLIRAGVSRGIAMQITGHKTEHVFERYNIVDSTDIREALIKVGEYAAKKTRSGDTKLMQNGVAARPDKMLNT